MSFRFKKFLRRFLFSIAARRDKQGLAMIHVNTPSNNCSGGDDLTHCAFVHLWFLYNMNLFESASSPSMVSEAQNQANYNTMGYNEALQHSSATAI